MSFLSSPTQIIRLISFLSRRTKLIYLLCLLLIILASIFEVLTIGTLSILTKLFTKESSEFIDYLINIKNNYLKIETNLTLILSIFFCFVSAFSGVFRIVSLYIGHKAGSLAGIDISSLLYKSLDLYRRGFLSNISESDLKTSLFVKVDHSISCLDQAVKISMNLLISLTLTSYLYSQYGLSVVFAIIILVSLYYLISLITKKILNQKSKIIEISKINAMSLIEYYLSFSRIIWLSGNQKKIKEKYINNDKKLRDSLAISGFISNLPKIAIETCLFLLIGLIFLIKSLLGTEVFAINLTFITIIGVAAFKLIPLLQGSFLSLSIIRSYLQELKSVNRLIKNISINPKIINLNNQYERDRNKFERYSLSIKKLDVGVSNKKLFSISNLKLFNGQSYAVLGKSGSGKTTFIDNLIKYNNLIDDGSVFIEANYIRYPISANMVSIVPQFYDVFPGSIAQNIIGFETPHDKINVDLDLFSKAISISKVNAFAKSFRECKSIYLGMSDSQKLSGGQLQRLSLARAIYEDRLIYIFDEVTSALDKDTSEEIVESILTSMSDKILLFITHSEFIKKKCNVAYYIDGKKFRELPRIEK
tara:strand:- start:2198 stop:3967 length:1770 start_codon:yes stop_codon:yes gene_type:complete